MREIKFRGKNTINGNFVEGYYNVEKGHHYINAGHTVYPIHPWSVGQFTGLKDKNGFEIYEGDILRTPRGDWGVVVWKSPFFEVTVSETQSSIYGKQYFDEAEIIGNIHENPELLNQ